MQQFDLSLWLQDKSRKVVTRDGREVRIICTDRNSRSGNIVGLVGKDESLIYVWNNDGKHIVSEIPDNDLFFADEEDGLTEFEKELNRIVQAFVDAHSYMDKVEIHHYAKGLLDLARKELIPIQDTVAYQEGVKEGRRLERQDIDKELDEAYKSRDEVVYLEGYDKGHEDALKDMPKFKKAKESRCLPYGVVKIDKDGKIVYSDMVWGEEYYIMLQSLESLPKEE